jgi:DNA-binding NtrC family response regulator/PAS domain-containing protein
VPGQYDQVGIADLKKRLLADPTLHAPAEYGHLAAEWRRSQALFPDRHVRKFGEDVRDLSLFDHLDPGHHVHLDYLREYYRAREAFLAAQGAALFYLDEGYGVYYKCGDKQLLAELKAKGMRVGTIFSEANVGAFVANLSHQKPFETIFRVGQENYLDIFCDYVCYARYVVRREPKFASINLVFLPLERYSDATHESICFALGVEDLSFRNRFMYPVIQQQLGLLVEAAQVGPDAFLLVNAQGEVVFVDDFFKREFGDPGPLVKGIPLEDVLPELKPFLAALEGPAVMPREIYAAGKGGDHRFYPVRCQRIGGGPKASGLKISILGQQYPKNGGGKPASFTFNDLIGVCPLMSEAKQAAFRAATSSSNVLITGESGTGKEMFAQAIHNASTRGDAPFIPINCGAIPKELIGSELFGYEGGAFTGSRREGAPGKFEQANGGTVFLDEIAEMPLDMQSFLLRFLEDGVVSRIGSKRFVKVDVRIIAATNRDLWDLVNQGAFRLDLYFRLNVLRLELPPLRQREPDIELLTEHFLVNLAKRMEKPVLRVGPDVIALFRRYDWPGNLRELRNILERCVNVVDGPELTLRSLPPTVLRSLGAASAMPRPGLAPVEPEHAAEPHQPPAEAAVLPTFQQFEADRIRRAMLDLRGNKSKVAQELGMSRATLYRKLQQMGY